jgi:hypothetical protein
MPTFRCPTNPTFRLKSMKHLRTITFKDGIYTTEDPVEVKLLRRSRFVEEIDIDESREKYVAGEIELEEFEADVEAKLKGDDLPDELDGVLPERVFVPGAAAPPLPDSAYPPDAKPLDPPEFATGGIVPEGAGQPRIDTANPADFLVPPGDE